jgi:glutamate racemase
MTPAPRILVLDSGVGGLSILEALKQGLSGCEFVYASDNAAFPYGLKSQAYLVERVEAVLKRLIKEVEPDIIVVACNTASTVVLPSIRDHFKAPVVGVVPAIKPAVALSRTGVIGLLGTPGTVNREYTQALIKEFANDCEIVKVGSSRLVEIAEQALRGSSPDKRELEEILAPLFAADKLDTIVLACTHFPLIVQALKDASPRTVNWIDSGEAIARRVESLIAQNSFHPKPVNQALPNKTFAPALSTKAIFTKASDEVNSLRGALLKFGCDNIAFCEDIALFEGLK